MKKWLILSAFILAALTSYGVGVSQGIMVLVGLGVIFELAFWFSVLKD